MVSRSREEARPSGIGACQEAPAQAKLEISAVSRTLVLGFEATRKNARGRRCLPPAGCRRVSPAARCSRHCRDRRASQHTPRRVRSRPRTMAIPLGACHKSAARNTRLRSTALQNDQIRGPNAGSVGFTDHLDGQMQAISISVSAAHPRPAHICRHPGDEQAPAAEHPARSRSPPAPGASLHRSSDAAERDSARSRQPAAFATLGIEAYLLYRPFPANGTVGRAEAGRVRSRGRNLPSPRPLAEPKLPHPRSRSSRDRDA